MDDAPAAGSDDHHVADGVLASVPAAAGSMLDSSRSSQRDEEQLQHSPAAQEQVLPEAPPEDDVWHDASEEFDAAGGAAGIHAADSGADDMPAAAAAAAADAFQANVRMLADLLQAGYTEAEIRSMWGDEMYVAVRARQQPTDAALRQAAAAAAAAEVVAGVSGDLQEGATIPAALADQGFTQQQQQQQHGAWDSDDACSDAGTEFSVQDDGEYASAEDEGAYVDAADTAAFGRPVEPAHGTAQWYRSNLAEPLWQSGEAIARLRIHQAVFMLMAWKADHCVRDNASAELLGMLSMLFLPEPPPGNRFKGFSPLLRDLYWVRPTSLFVVPFSHAFFLGVFKRLISLMFAKESKQQDEGDDAANPLRIPNHAKRVMRGRLERMQLHPSFNRKCRSPFTSNASWQIEECERQMQCFLPLLFRPVRGAPGQATPVLHNDLAKTAFGHLKRFAAFHLGHVAYATRQEYVQAAVQAHEELLAYGRLVEEHTKGSACTYNLHMLACQLLMQALKRGATYEQFELWVERLIGEIKQRVKLRTHADPEKTMMGDDMLRRALQRWRLQFSDLQTWQEFRGQARRQRLSLFDPVGDLLGSSQVPSSEAWSAAVQSAAKAAVQFNVEAVGGVAEQKLWLDGWEQVSAAAYKEALLPGGFYATSTAFTRSRSRDGSFVLVPFSSGNETKPWVGRVTWYLRLSLPAATAQQSQRGGVLLFALCDLMPYLQPFEDQDICGSDSMILFGRDQGARERTFSHQNYPVMLNQLHAPLFRQEYTADGQTWWAFVPLTFRTGGKR
ncbi:hypothetical protein COO60DRAFT_1706343 [Scenedesmus sp. NREL 46B-D3]|nr:hypothetical protein COO60DRAFT_1706343 [Scenedesmus sp. NREL 46B-D3]